MMKTFGTDVAGTDVDNPYRERDIPQGLYLLYHGPGNVTYLYAKGAKEAKVKAKAIGGKLFVEVK